MPGTNDLVPGKDVLNWILYSNLTFSFSASVITSVKYQVKLGTASQNFTAPTKSNMNEALNDITRPEAKSKASQKSNHLKVWLL